MLKQLKLLLLVFVMRLFQGSRTDTREKFGRDIAGSWLLSERIILITLLKSILILEMLLVLLALQFYAPVPSAGSVISLKLEQAAQLNPVGELCGNVALGEKMQRWTSQASSSISNL